MKNQVKQNDTPAVGETWLVATPHGDKEIVLTQNHIDYLYSGWPQAFKRKVFSAESQQPHQT